MASVYKDNMSVTLSEYYRHMQNARDRKAKVEAEYGEEAGRREAESLARQLASIRAATVQALDQNYEKGVEQTKAWGTLNGAHLTDDAKLLSAGLVDPEQFEELKAKYADNFTMLSALRKYGEQRNAEALQRDGAASPGSGFLVGDIPTVKGRLEAWEKLRRGADQVMSMIEGSGQYGEGDMPTILKYTLTEVLENFGQNAPV